MFSNCSNLTSLDLSNFNTSKVTKMNWMFRAMSSLTSLNLSSFDTSNVTDMSYMFGSCKNLNTVYVTNGKWSTSQENINSMLYQCKISSVTYN